MTDPTPPARPDGLHSTGPQQARETTTMDSNAPEKRLTRNAARCHRCGVTIESKYRWNYVTCKCGDVSVDGGLAYEKRGYREGATWDELSEYAEVAR